MIEILKYFTFWFSLIFYILKENIITIEYHRFGSDLTITGFCLALTGSDLAALMNIQRHLLGSHGFWRGSTDESLVR